MAGLVPAIHVFTRRLKTWMPGTRPGMTKPIFWKSYSHSIVPGGFEVTS